MMARAEKETAPNKLGRAVDAEQLSASLRFRSLKFTLLIDVSVYLCQRFL